MFVPNSFTDGVAGGTPITAATLNNLENGLVAADITNPASAATTALAAAITAQAEPVGLSPATKTVLTTAYAASRSSRLASLIVPLGDSETAGSDLPATAYQSVSWPTLAGLFSQGKVQIVTNAGIPGNTTAAMLARFDTDVTPFSPAVVPLLAGTNDTPSISVAAWSAIMVQIIAKIRAISAVPVMATIAPRSNVIYRQWISQANAWIRRYAAQNGIAVIPFWETLADPATGDFLSAYLNDGVHPNAAGFTAMGAAAAAVLAPLTTSAQPLLCGDDYDPNTNLYKGCFGGYSGTTLPTGWIDNAGTTGSVLSYVTDTAVRGQMIKLTNTAAPSARQLIFNQYCGTTTLSNAQAAGDTTVVLPIRADFMGVLFIGTGATYEVVKIQSSAGGGPQTETLVNPLKYAHAAGEQVIANGTPGDTMLISGYVTSDGGAPISIGTQLPGAAYSATAFAGTVAITRGVFHQRFVLPAATTGINTFIQLGAGTGSASFGQIGLYNASRLSV